MTTTMTHPHFVPSPGLWTLAWRRMCRDHVGMVSLVIVAAFILMMIASGFKLIAKDWSKEVGTNYAPPSFVGAEAGPAASKAVSDAGEGELMESNVSDPIASELAELRMKLKGGAPAGAAAEGGVVDPLAEVMAEIKGKGGTEAVKEQRAATLIFGGDKWGRDVLQKVIKGSETSIFVGLAAALVATLLGTIFGAFSGYYGKWVDDFFNWFYSVFTSIPYLLLILAIAAVLQQKGLMTIILILGLTGWTGIYRLIRAEYLKHKSREYVQAADAIGASGNRRMFVHILPNVSHVILVQMSLHVVQFIKAEVILSFLGFGVPVDVVSWGSMLNEAQNELILGKWWQLVVAGTAMAVLVTAFSMLTDSLRDALDPKLK
ncbi:Oligopeptide transport system permease protein OppC [Burkholderiales bacterium]|nr:MAG: ABC transporter permease [Burkholderiales bacterium]CAG0960665.1 Oligopeptide transport system permease protein OppC [Burkholderiales bacterium]